MAENHRVYNMIKKVHEAFAGINKICLYPKNLIINEIIA